MQKKYRSNTYARKFTLLELLVVVSIMIILMSMLLPALSKARASAKSIGCISNLKQIGAGVIMYAGDYNSYITPCRIVPSWTWWYTSLKPYVTQGGIRVFKCPGIADNDPRVPTDKNSSYGYNRNTYSEDSTSIRRSVYRKIEQIYKPLQRQLTVDVSSLNACWFNEDNLAIDISIFPRHGILTGVLYIGGNASMSDCRTWKQEDINLSERDY